MSRSDFTTIRTEGALLPPGLLKRLREPKNGLPGSDDAAYHVAPPRRLTEVISEAWNTLQGTWTAYREARDRLPNSDTGTTLTRERWLQPLFQALGYGRLLPRTAETIDGVSYPISHGWHHVPIHLVSHRVDLDRRTAGVAGAARTSPHGLLQGYLNATDDSLWGIVSNGHRLRLLRDHHALTRQSYVEYDLEAMFDGEVYSDFVLLYLTLHQSRLEAAKPTETLLEQWATLAREHGTRALDRLRDGVERALKALGQGFLDHPANTTLKQRLRDGDLDPQDYYRQLLRLVYRLLVLFAAEDRDLLHPPATSDAAKRRYAHYGTRHLRDVADKVRGGPHPDRYEVFKRLTHWLGQDGAPDLGLPALGGFLFGSDATPDLDNAQLANRMFLRTVRALAFTDTDGARLPVDYRNLGAEELGSVYESLLELHPTFESDHFDLTTAAGSERKTTGSYYTPTSLITLLLDSALDPVLDEAARAPNPERAILDLKIVDPASGSGHFLIAAAHRIARRLAQVRTGDEEPAIDATRTALRDVIGHCLYAVDLNPMAVELCKVALWLEALEPGKPLTFLDHHMKTGNSLIGTDPRDATQTLVEDGIPDAAFDPLEGDEKALTRSARDTSRRERGGEQGLFARDSADKVQALASVLKDINEAADATIEQLRDKQRRYEEFERSREYRTAIDVADAWTLAFVWPKSASAPTSLTSSDLWTLHSGGSIGTERRRLLDELRQQYRPFQWSLEFPEVFDRPSPGFDIVLGNPPWETLSPDAKEFFAKYDPQIRHEDKAGQAAIMKRHLGDESIAASWASTRRALFGLVHFLKSSGRYRMFASGNLGKGDFNTFRFFVETALDLARRNGTAAQYVPDGLYMGANSTELRRTLLEECRLYCLYGFRNAHEMWFRGTDSRLKFCLYSVRLGRSTTNFRAAFNIASAEQLDHVRAGTTINVPTSIIREFAPETLSIMEFDDQRDIDITTKIMSRWPRFGEAVLGQPHRDYMREVDMGTDRSLFSDVPEGLPVFEGRMVNQYDHRAKGYRSGRGRSAEWADLEFGEPAKTIQPQWYVPTSIVPEKAMERTGRYRIGFCDVASPTNARSLVAALLPPGVIAGHKVPTILVPTNVEWTYMVWLAAANSFTLDYLVRKKISLSMSYTVLDSVPIPRLQRHDGIAEVLVPLAARLTCCGAEMRAYWDNLVASGWDLGDPTESPCEENPRARLGLAARIEAIVARDVYGLSREELAIIMDTFPIVERRETAAFGRFESKELALQAFDS